MNKLFFVGLSVLFLITACSNETEEEKKAKAAAELIDKWTEPVDCSSGPNRPKSCPSYEAKIPPLFKDKSKTHYKDKESSDKESSQK